jgi:pentatricopeptide repeat protein
MKLSTAVAALCVSFAVESYGYTLSQFNWKMAATPYGSREAGVAAALGQTPQRRGTQICSTVLEAETATAGSEVVVPQSNILSTPEEIGQLTFRELQKECKSRGIPAIGTTATLRQRLVGALCAPGDDECIAAISEDDVASEAPEGISFEDTSDPEFDYNSLVSDVEEACDEGHWKKATRKMKTLTRRYVNSARPNLPAKLLVKVLTCYSADRLHGARASQPARKVMEVIADFGYQIPSVLGNKCVVDAIGKGQFGGVDVALAMLSAMESSGSLMREETYDAIVGALAREGSVEEAVLLVRAMVVEKAFTPPLSTFASVADPYIRGKAGNADSMVQLLTLAKTAGYELDSVASAEAGRQVLSAGVIAAEEMDNLALGLRLLTAAQKAEGCEPDRGDDLVCSSSKRAQRASTLIHRRAIDKAVQEDNWKLAVRLLQLMPERGLTPAGSVWRKVVTVCAKSEKSRKATALLLDWVSLHEAGTYEKPPLYVFNTVMNACEICGEEELTLKVLDSLKATHETEGNIITFNIALKRLAKLGNAKACEAILIGMLQNEVEPTVVSYTTAIAACAKEGLQDSAFAREWLTRMKSRNVQPNLYSYNTALVACLDGKLESTVRASNIATEMLQDVAMEIAKGGAPKQTSVVPDSYTKVLARSLMKQLRENWRAGDVDMAEAKSTIRVPLLKLVDFEKSEAAAKALEVNIERRKILQMDPNCDPQEEECLIKEIEVEYSNIQKTLHKENRRIAEV